MSDLNLSNNKEKWQRSIENMHNQQLKESLGILFEKDRPGISDHPGKTMSSDSMSNLHKSNKELNRLLLRSESKDKLQERNESKYVSVLQTMEKLMPKYQVIIK